jgi:hypothetical protein
MSGIGVVRSASGRGDGVELRHRRKARIGVLGRNARQARTLTRCTTPPSSARENREQQANHGHPTVAIEGIGASRRVRRYANRRVVKPKHQRITLDLLRWEANFCARSRCHLYFEGAVRPADDFLAGKAVTL